MKIVNGIMPTVKRKERASKYDALLNMNTEQYATFDIENESKIVSKRSAIYQWAKKRGVKVKLRYNQNTKKMYASIDKPE